MRILGIDLAWGQGRPGVPPNESGLVAVDPDGRIVDAPLVVDNATGMRECEKEIGRRYSRWKVSANASNRRLPGVLAGVVLAERLAGDGWEIADGRGGQAATGRVLYECFPYLALVGAPALGYDRERPIYKRKPRQLAPAEFRVLRAGNADEIVRRVALLDDPPIDLRSHPVTATLLDEPTPLVDRAAKHREDLLDAVLCAWTGLLWWHHGLVHCQVLGGDESPPATVIAPCRPEQRRPIAP